MRIAKRDIVEMLLIRRDHQRAIRADEELPEVVHVERHSGLLRDLGLDPALLLRDLGKPSRRLDRRRPSRRSASSPASIARTTSRRS